MPDFTNEGKLFTEVYICSEEEFINRFCVGEPRKNFEKPINDILDYAKERGTELVDQLKHLKVSENLILE